MSVVVVLCCSSAAFWAVPDADHLFKIGLRHFTPNVVVTVPQRLTSAGSLKNGIECGKTRAAPCQTQPATEAAPLQAQGALNRSMAAPSRASPSVMLQ